MSPTKAHFEEPYDLEKQPHNSDGESELQKARSAINSKGNEVSEGNMGTYYLNPDQLNVLVDTKVPWALKAIGGPKELAKILNTDTEKGLSLESLGEAEVKIRQSKYGSNCLPEKKTTGFFKIVLLTLDDKVLIILIIAALISLALGLYETFGGPTEYYSDGTVQPELDWVEGVAILVAVTIVTIVGSANDWQKERQFAKLNRKKELRLIEVIRSGSQQQISIEDLLVGDIIRAQPGDILPADGVLLQSTDLQCDESSVTGESDTMKKYSAIFSMEQLNKSQTPSNADCLIISGAKVMQGNGRYLVTAVGTNSMWGRTMMSLREGSEVTPLQEKLNRIADGIAKFGVWSALILFTVLLVRFLIEITGNRRYSLLPSSVKGNKFMDIFIVSVTIVVVAVPEGLPLAVTLSLAFATTRMVKDNCLVRVLKSCETMGGATSVCSDKTGTLTENKMTVVQSLVGNHRWEMADSPNATNANPLLQGESVQAPAKNNYSTELITLLRYQLCLNSTVYEKQDSPEEFVGSKTEMALVNYARLHCGIAVGELESYRCSQNVVYVLPFDSARKYMLTIVKIGENHYRMLVKGAAEIIMGLSSSFLEEEDDNQRGGFNVESLSSEQSDSFTNTINSYADNALRCIAAAYKDFKVTEEVDWSRLSVERLEVENLVFTGIFGIQDPLRPGVKKAVMQCQRAGIVVRMVTGDNSRTARAISLAANIISETPDEDDIIIEGPSFRELSDIQLDKIAHKIKILARSSPQDKRRLVEILKNQGETVAVTGDGTNDAPALRLADVGFSMGISGTEVAKEASDIIIMDDNFASIVKALKWGRTVNDSVKKFLQFQLTVNITAVTLAFVSAVASSTNQSVLTAVQLLWVNLIMDTLAALALATDAPTDAVLDRPPDNRKKSLITPTMWEMIFGQSIFQLCVTFVLHFAGSKLFHYSKPVSGIDQTTLSAMVFNTFVWMQFFNMFVNRRLDNKNNIFNGILKNPFFPVILIIIGGFQVLIMFVGGAAFQINRQTPAMWATALICGFCSILIAALIRLIPDKIVLFLFPRTLWHWFMVCLDSCENGFLWLMSPIIWLCKFVFRGIKQMAGAKSKSEDKEDSEISKAVGHDEKHSRGSKINSNYKWAPGIEKSLADISFLQRVRGGRSRQLNTFFKNPPQIPVAFKHSRESMQSLGSNTSTLAAFMAPMVVGGAIGGWAPVSKDTTNPK